jgi:hypothetical protein
MALLDRMIATKRLTNFIHEFLRIRNDELEEKSMWEFWLHRVHDMSFNDFVKKAKTAATEPETLEDEKIESIIAESQNILNGFTLV